MLGPGRLHHSLTSAGIKYSSFCPDFQCIPSMWLALSVGVSSGNSFLKIQWELCPSPTRFDSLRTTMLGLMAKTRTGFELALSALLGTDVAAQQLDRKNWD